MRIFIAMLAFAGLFANASDMKDAAYKAVENSRAQLEDFRKSRVEKISQKKIGARCPIKRDKGIAGA